MTSTVRSVLCFSVLSCSISTGEERHHVVRIEDLPLLNVDLSEIIREVLEIFHMVICLANSRC